MIPSDAAYIRTDVEILILLGGSEKCVVQFSLPLRCPLLSSLPFAPPQLLTSATPSSSTPPTITPPTTRSSTTAPSSAIAPSLPSTPPPASPTPAPSSPTAR